jgi:hypothetical protein
LSISRIVKKLFAPKEGHTLYFYHMSCDFVQRAEIAQSGLPGDGDINPNYGKGRLDRPITGSRIVQADLVGPIEIPRI